MWRLLSSQRVVIQCISCECDIAMQCGNDQMVYCIFFLALCRRKAVLLRGMMHRHIRSDACAQNQFYFEAFLYWSVLEIFGSSENTPNRVWAFWKFSEVPKIIFVSSENTQKHLRALWKFLEVPKIHRSVLEIFESSENIFWKFRKLRWLRFSSDLEFSEVPKIPFIALQRADLCCGYKYPPPLTCEGCWFHSNYLCPWLALSL